MHRKEENNSDFQTRAQISSSQGQVQKTANISSKSPAVNLVNFWSSLVISIPSRQDRPRDVNSGELQQHSQLAKPGNPYYGQWGVTCEAHSGGVTYESLTGQGPASYSSSLNWWQGAGAGGTWWGPPWPDQLSDRSFKSEKSCPGRT